MTSATIPPKYIKILYKVRDELYDYEGVKVNLGINNTVDPIDPETPFVYWYPCLTDIDPPNPTGYCFIKLEHLCRDIGTFAKVTDLIADVEVLDGEIVYDESIVKYHGHNDTISKHHYKANKIIVSNPRLLADLPQWRDPEFCLNAVKQSGYSLVYISDLLKTTEIYLTAVRKDGNVLTHIKHENQTEEMCSIAVKQSTWAFLDAADNVKTYDLCLYAVKNAGVLLKYVPERYKTKELCLAAFQKNCDAFEYIPLEYKTRELCLAALEKNGHLLQYIPNEKKTKEIYFAAIDSYFCGFRFLDVDFNQLDIDTYLELCMIAMKKVGRQLSYVNADKIGPLNYFKVCQIAVDYHDYAHLDINESKLSPADYARLVTASKEKLKRFLC
jgi:hypothetical protein